jgi:hypothetical protein
MAVSPTTEKGTASQTLAMVAISLGGLVVAYRNR